ncbi:hypothetical protein LXL04_020695 [Taraxacum kok-saghyz]
MGRRCDPPRDSTATCWLRHNQAEAEPRYRHNQAEAEPGYRHNQAEAEPGYRHNQAEAEPRYRHNQAEAEPGYQHNQAEAEPRYRHNQAEAEPRYRHSQTEAEPYKVPAFQVSGTAGINVKGSGILGRIRVIYHECFYNLFEGLQNLCFRWVLHHMGSGQIFSPSPNVLLVNEEHSEPASGSLMYFSRFEERNLETPLISVLHLNGDVLLS